MSAAKELLKSKYEDIQAYKRKYWPNLWSEIRELICLATVITSYILITYMAIFDYRQVENIPILVIIYSCDLLYIIDMIFRLVVHKRQAKRERAEKLHPRYGRLMSALVTPHAEQTPPPPDVAVASMGLKVSRTERWKRNARHFFCSPFRKKYLSVFLDFLSILPFELLVLIINLRYQQGDKEYLIAFSCLKLNRLFRFYRLLIFYRQKIHEVRVNLTRREILTMSVYFASFLAILFHSIACLWYRLSCDGVYKTNEPVQCYRLGESGDEKEEKEYNANNSSGYHRNANYTGYRPMFSAEEGAWGIYVSQVHWAVTSLRNSGNRYDPPVTAPQLILAMSIQIFGFLMCTGIMLVAIYVSSQLDLTRAIFFHEAYGATTFVRHFKMSGTVVKFLNSCFNFMWKHNRAFTDYNVRPILCRTMRTKILMCVFEPMIQASELLKCFTREELEKLALDIQYKHYFAHEFIVRPNTVGHNVFYIVQGSVEVMSDEDPTLAIMTLNSGSLIGEVNIVFPTRRSHGVKTRTPSDILMLPFSSVMEVGKFEAQRLGQMMAIVRGRMNWLAEENEKKFKEELDQLKAEQVADANRKKSSSVESSHPDEGSSHSILNPMEILLYRRHKALTATGVRTSDSGRKLSDGPTRKPKGAQFMSVLAWLTFFKWERRARRAGVSKSRRYIDIYSRVQPKFRNEASMKMYRIIETIPTIPKYIWGWRTVISKDSHVFGIWDCFVMLIVAIYGFVYPIEILISNSAEEICTDINVFVDVVYALDLFLRLFLFMEVDEIVPNLSSLRSHLWHEFCTVDIWFDVIPVLPIHYFISLELDSEDYRQYMYARLPLYIFKSIKLLLFIRQWENNVRINVTLVRIFKHLLHVAVYVMWLGSTFTYLGCPNYPNCTNAAKHHHHHHKHPPISVPSTHVINETWVDKFLKHYNFNGTYQIGNFPYAFPLSMFWAICAVFGIQFDIATPSTRDETALQAIGLLGGFALIIYFISDLAATIAGFVENKINHVDKLLWIKNYMDEELIALKLIDRVTHYMNVQWKALRGLSSEASNTSGFLAVSHTMNIELMVHIVGECLLNAYFFQHMDTDMLRKFSLAAMVAVIPPEEEILKSGDLVARMYIIRRGYVQVYYEDTDIKMDVLTSGQSFGEVNMFYGTPSRVTCRAVTYVELIMVDSRSFERILQLSKIHQDELKRLRADKIGLTKFNATLESVLDNLSDLDLTQRKYRSMSLEASPFRRFRREVTRVNKRGIPVTTMEPRQSFERVYNQHKCFKWLRKLLLPLTYMPDGLFLRSWEHFRVCTICLIIILVPPIEAYPDFKILGRHYMYILDVFTFVDMYIRAHIAYYDSRTMELITHPLYTTKHYLASGFLADFLGSLPVYALIDFLFEDSEWDATLLAFLLRLNRLILIYRVVGMYRYKRQGRASIGMPIRKMLMLFPVFLFHIHIVACMISVIACPSTMKAWNVVHASTPNTRCYDHSWVTTSKHKEVTNPSSSKLYVYAFYYVGTTSIGLGFGDFKPSNQAERMIATFTFFCYIFALTYILAAFAGSRSHIDYKLLRFQQHMKYLVGFIAHEKLETQLASRIIRHYNHQWVRTHGVEPQRLFSNLFPALRKEVALDVFEDVFGEVPELKGVSESFLRTICVYMVPIYFLRRDVIVRRTDICDTIYFIFRGKVAASKYEYDEETIMEKGSIIGILDPGLKNPVYDRTVVSITNVDLFAIPRKDFIRALQAYPEVNHRFDARNLAGAVEVEEVSQELEWLRARQRLRKGAKNSSSSVILQPSRAASRHVSISANLPTRAKNKTNPASPGSPAGDLGSSSSSSPFLQEPGSISRAQLPQHHNTRADLQHEMRREDSISELKSDYSEYSVSMVLQEDNEQKVKYDEDTLYAQSILPESACVRALVILVFISACLSASIAFYQYTFTDYHPALVAIVYLCDITFIVKMCMSFRVSYFNELGDVVTDTTEISNKYLSEISGFTLDFFSTFPLEIFSGVYALAKPKQEGFDLVLYWWAALRLNRLARFFHVVLFYKRRTSAFLVHLIPVKLERILVSTLIYIHIMACILYSNTDLVELKQPCNCKSTSICRTEPADLEVWFQTKNIVGSEAKGSHLPCHKYTLSLYFVVTTFTSTSYADMFPVRVFEMIFTTILAYSSKVWVCLVLSDIMSGLQNNVDLSYHLAAEGVLRLYKDYGVSRPVREKTADYFAYAWQQNRGILFPDFLQRAPASLKMDICTTIYGDHFRKSYLFRGLPDSFIRQACIRLTQEWIMAGDYVIRQGEIDDKLYFIHHGIIDYSREDPAGTLEQQAQNTSASSPAASPQPGAGPSSAVTAGIPIHTGHGGSGRRRRSRRRRRHHHQTSLTQGFMSRSKHFGELQGIMGAQPHTCSYRAETNVDVVSLSHADLEELFNLFPEYRHTVTQRFQGKFTPTNTGEPAGEGGGGGGRSSGSAGVTYTVKASPTLRHIKMVEEVEGGKLTAPQDDSLLQRMFE